MLEKDQELYRKHIIRYMEHNGYDVLEKDYDGFIVMLDDRDIAFVDPFVKYGNVGKPDVESNRDKFEEVISKYCKEIDDLTDARLRYDTCCLNVLKEDRGIIVHHVNVRWN